MEQKLPSQMQQRQKFGNGLNRASLLPGEAHSISSQCAPFADASSCDHSDLTPEASRQSVTSLREHDYIGLAEVSSMPPVKETQDVSALILVEPDLRLGLGLPNLNHAETASELKEGSTLGGLLAPDAGHVNENGKLLSFNAQQCAHLKTLPDAISAAHVQGHPNLAQLNVSRNSPKRLYAEAMADAPRESAPAVQKNSLPEGGNAVESWSTASSFYFATQFQDAELKTFSHGACLSARRCTPWQCERESFVCPYEPEFRRKSPPVHVLKGELEGTVSRHSNVDFRFYGIAAKPESFARQGVACDESQPARDQVVGWPPVRSYRRSALSICPTKLGENQSATFVKVNMDGIPVGRKVDLSTCSSYDGLLSALEEMFRSPNGGCGGRSLKGADFVLTYEDKEGDWMLVGDVPWELFVKAVQRLRIVRGSEMAGLGKV